MTNDASLATKVAYCLAVLGAVVPIGLAKSDWVALGTGVTSVLPIPYVGPILLLALGLYRVIVVIRSRNALSSPAAQGFVALLRSAGIFLIYIGAISAVISWISGPLMQSVLRSRTESGAEFFAVGLLLTLLGSTGTLGLLLFEFGRLRSFESYAQEQA
ncbi:hypothetical protein [Thermomonas brevis]